MLPFTYNLHPILGQLVGGLHAVCVYVPLNKNFAAFFITPDFGRSCFYCTFFYSYLYFMTSDIMRNCFLCLIELTDKNIENDIPNRASYIISLESEFIIPFDILLVAWLGFPAYIKYQLRGQPCWAQVLSLRTIRVTGPPCT